jgi:hypothetical protein
MPTKAPTSKPTSAPTKWYWPFFKGLRHAHAPAHSRGQPPLAAGASKRPATQPSQPKVTVTTLHAHWPFDEDAYALAQMAPALDFYESGRAKAVTSGEQAVDVQLQAAQDHSNSNRVALRMRDFLST